MSSNSNQEELRQFISTQAGKWLIDNIDLMRTNHYEKGEKTPENASLELAKAAGNVEVKNWIKSQVVNLKG